MVIQDVKRKNELWVLQLENLRVGQKVLERQRFTFPPNWLWLERVEGEYAHAPLPTPFEDTRRWEKQCVTLNTVCQTLFVPRTASDFF